MNVNLPQKPDPMPLRHLCAYLNHLCLLKRHAPVLIGRRSSRLTRLFSVYGKNLLIAFLLTLRSRATPIGAPQLHVRLFDMATCACPMCSTIFQARWNRKLMHNPNFSPIGAAGTFVRDLNDFNRVICPNCGHQFACETIRMFGIFPRHLFWVPFVLVFLAALGMWLYVTQ